MKRIALLSLFTSTCARAGTSDPGGIFTGILWLLGIGFCLWALFAFVLARVIARSTLWRTLIASGLAAAPLAYCGFTSYQFHSGLDDLRSLNEQLSASANSYLLQKCAQERHQSAKPVVAEAGVLVDINSKQWLSLRDAPLPPSETQRMRLNQKRYGESYPVATNKLQYETPVYLVHQFYPESVLIASRFEFVESPGTLSNSGRPVLAVARKHWWLGPGQSRVSAANSQEFERRLVDMPEVGNYWLSQSVTSSRAKYIVSIQDISTTEDRQHWVARARITLSDRESSEVVAEYVGFAANQDPAYQPHESLPWERVNVCPGKEQRYVHDRMPWDVVGFFFREVVIYQGM